MSSVARMKLGTEILTRARPIERKSGCGVWPRAARAGEKQRLRAQERGDRQAVRDDLVDIARFGPERPPEIQPDQVGQVLDILHRQRLVQAVEAPQVLQRLR